MAQLIKDFLSLLVYVFITLFFRRKGVVLVYHSIDDVDPAKDPQKISVKPALFEKQMHYLATRRKKFIITFDDGFANVYMNAFPVLKRYGISSILFVTTAFIDNAMTSDDLFKNAQALDPLTWEQIRAMRSGGVEIGSHSLSHRNIAALDAEVAYREASVSRERIEAMTGCTVRSFSYPFGNRGSFNDRTQAMLRKAGYTKAYTNTMGMDSSERDPFTVRRIRIYSDDTMFRFKMKVAGAYNWIDSLLYFRNLFP